MGATKSDPGERIATLSAQEPHAHHDIVDAFKTDLVLKSWTSASLHYLGNGLQTGEPSFRPASIVKKAIGKQVAQEKLEARARSDSGLNPDPPPLPASLRLSALEAVNCGAGTTGERYRPPRICHRCDWGVIETARHRYYDCPDNTSAEMVSLEPALGQLMKGARSLYLLCFSLSSRFVSGPAFFLRQQSHSKSTGP